MRNKVFLEVSTGFEMFPLLSVGRGTYFIGGILVYRTRASFLRGGAIFAVILVFHFIANIELP